MRENKRFTPLETSNHCMPHGCVANGSNQAVGKWTLTHSLALALATETVRSVSKRTFLIESNDE